MFGGFPFHDFEHGMGGRARHHGPVNNSRYYDVLGVEKTCTPGEMKKAYQRLALRMHPDKGGDPEKFKEINEAYDILKNPEKRDLYDELGEDALKEGVGPSTSGHTTMADVFEHLIGVRSGGRRPHGRWPPKGEDMVHSIDVTLEEMYNGATRSFPMTKRQACGDCNGSGSQSGKKQICRGCNGDGIEVIIHQMGIGLVQQIQRTCRHCGGKGKDVPISMICLRCHGSGLVEESKVQEFCVEQGMRDNSKIVLAGEAGISSPEEAPGDLIVVVKGIANKEFKRRNADLIVHRTIGLSSALCGMDISIRHLDNREIRMVSDPGEVIQPGQWKCIDGEGMPVHGHPLIKGNLYVHFDISFPRFISPTEQNALSSVLGDEFMAEGGDHEAGVPSTNPPVVGRDVENAEEEFRNRAKFGRNSSAYDSDGESGDFQWAGRGGGSHVHCAQQ